MSSVLEEDIRTGELYIHQLMVKQKTSQCYSKFHTHYQFILIEIFVVSNSVSKGGSVCERSGFDGLSWVLRYCCPCILQHCIVLLWLLPVRRDTEAWRVYPGRAEDCCLVELHCKPVRSAALLTWILLIIRRKLLTEWDWLRQALYTHSTASRGGHIQCYWLAVTLLLTN